jgi:dihydrofolate reductase
MKTKIHSNSKISIICALAKNYVIGYKNQLPWHLPADLKHFKELTLGKPIIMGRKTFISIGKPLPQRRNIIITRDKNLIIPGCEIVHSLKEALTLTKASEEIMIIGGANIFAQALPCANRMYLTIIQHDFVGDVYFPKWNVQEWKIIECADYTADEKNPYPYSFLTLERSH